MDQKVKWQLVIAIFALCWMLYLMLPGFAAQRDIAPLLEPFSSEPANLVFLMIIFLAFSIGLTDLSELVYQQVRRLKWFRPRLGEILIASGYISREELEDALEEQKTTAWRRSRSTQADHRDRIGTGLEDPNGSAQQTIGNPSHRARPLHRKGCSMGLPSDQPEAG